MKSKMSTDYSNRARRTIIGHTLFPAMLLCAGLAYGGEPIKRVFEVAAPRERLPGVPQASDVIIRSLSFHPSDKVDPRDTMKAIRDFHATRLEWTYCQDRASVQKVTASGRLFGGCVNAMSYRSPAKEPAARDMRGLLNLDGERITLPSHRKWPVAMWGFCVNDPLLEPGYVNYLKKCIDTGAQVMQRDEPRMNLMSTDWGGCFCDHCMRAFRQYLADNTTPVQRQSLGIADLPTFDYRKKLKEQGAPVGDDFGAWDGGELKRLFVDFQTQATAAFHQRTRNAINRYAGRRVPFSCNNNTRHWGPIDLEFDWFCGELGYLKAQPQPLYDAMSTAASHNRVQVVTMPLKGNNKKPERWQQRTRQSIAMAYACGGLCMVPWDTYTTSNTPRYFGTPQQYADLYGFVRANARYLDGYEEAAVFGNALRENRYGSKSPVSLSGGSGQTCLLVRAKPNDPDVPVVIHVVEWSESPQPCTVRLENACFYGARAVQAKLLAPPKYDRGLHETAEATHNYQTLSVSRDVKLKVAGEQTVIEVEAVQPWGVLVISPRS